MSAEPDSGVATTDQGSKEPAEWEVRAAILEQVRKDQAGYDFDRWKVNMQLGP